MQKRLLQCVSIVVWTMKNYNELISLESIVDRYNYLRIGRGVGEETFGTERYLNQLFYHSREYKKFRGECIIRDSDGDNVLELGCPGFPINGRIYVHHIVPITIWDLHNEGTDFLLDPNNAICCSKMMHDAIHYGDDSYVRSLLTVMRSKNDTSPWRK